MKYIRLGHNKSLDKMRLKGLHLWIRVKKNDIIEFSIENKDNTTEKHITYKLNSVFPVIITDLPKGAKLGDWVTIEGGAFIDFPWS